MSAIERDIGVIDHIPFRQDKRHTSRRDLIKTGLLTTLASPLLAAAVIHDDIKSAIDDPSQIPALQIKYEGGLRAGWNNIKSELGIGPEIDGEVAQIANELNVNLINVRDVHKIVSSKDQSNYVWDKDRALLLKQCYGVLPDHFRSPDKDNVPLSITLTDIKQLNPSDAKYIGNYYYGLKENIMVLDEAYFKPDFPDSSLRLLTHENIHYMQDSGRSKLEEVVREDMGIEPKEFCTMIDQSLRGFSFPNYGQVNNEAYKSLLYGVAQPDIAFEDESRIRTNFIELEAVLGEHYLKGKDVFVDEMSPIVGKKIAYLFYRYTKNVPFRQFEYGAFPQI